MADSTVASLAAATALTGAELFYAVQGGADVKVRADDIRPKSNFVATTAPAATDDSASGYAVGSRWQNTATAEAWTARSVGVGAAVWVKEDLADHPGYVSGNYYHGNTGISLAAGVALPGNAVRLVPLVLKTRVTISQLATRITTAAAAGNIQFAVYANNPTTGMPTGLPLCSTVSQTTAAAGPFGVALSAGNVTLEPGVYWFAVNSDNATVVCQVYATAQVVAGYMIGSPTLSDITGSSTQATLVLSVAAQTFGTWNDLTAASFTRVGSNGYAAPMFKVA